MSVTEADNVLQPLTNGDIIATPGIKDEVYDASSGSKENFNLKEVLASEPVGKVTEIAIVALNPLKSQLDNAESIPEVASSITDAPLSSKVNEVTEVHSIETSPSLSVIAEVNAEPASSALEEQATSPNEDAFSEPKEDTLEPQITIEETTAEESLVEIIKALESADPAHDVVLAGAEDVSVEQATSLVTPVALTEVEPAVIEEPAGGDRPAPVPTITPATEEPTAAEPDTIPVVDIPAPPAESGIIDEAPAVDFFEETAAAADELLATELEVVADAAVLTAPTTVTESLPVNPVVVDGTHAPAPAPIQEAAAAETVESIITAPIEIAPAEAEPATAPSEAVPAVPDTLPVEPSVADEVPAPSTEVASVDAVEHTIAEPDTIPVVDIPAPPAESGIVDEAPAVDLLEEIAAAADELSAIEPEVVADAAVLTAPTTVIESLNPAIVDETRVPTPASIQEMAPAETVESIITAPIEITPAEAEPATAPSETVPPVPETLPVEPSVADKVPAPSTEVVSVDAVEPTVINTPATEEPSAMAAPVIQESAVAESETVADATPSAAQDPLPADSSIAAPTINEAAPAEESGAAESKVVPEISEVIVAGPDAEALPVERSTNHEVSAPATETFQEPAPVELVAPVVTATSPVEDVPAETKPVDAVDPPAVDTSATEEPLPLIIPATQEPAEAELEAATAAPEAIPSTAQDAPSSAGSPVGAINTDEAAPADEPAAVESEVVPEVYEVVVAGPDVEALPVESSTIEEVLALASESTQEPAPVEAVGSVVTAITPIGDAPTEAGPIVAAEPEVIQNQPTEPSIVENIAASTLEPIAEAAIMEAVGTTSDDNPTPNPDSATPEPVVTAEPAHAVEVVDLVKEAEREILAPYESATEAVEAPISIEAAATPAETLVQDAPPSEPVINDKVDDIAVETDCSPSAAVDLGVVPEISEVGVAGPDVESLSVEPSTIVEVPAPANESVEGPAYVETVEPATTTASPVQDAPSETEPSVVANTAELEVVENPPIQSNIVEEVSARFTEPSAEAVTVEVVETASNEDFTGPADFIEVNETVAAPETAVVEPLVPTEEIIVDIVKEVEPSAAVDNVPEATEAPSSTKATSTSVENFLEDTLADEPTNVIKLDDIAVEVDASPATNILVDVVEGTEVEADAVDNFAKETTAGEVAELVIADNAVEADAPASAEVDLVNEQAVSVAPEETILEPTALTVESEVFKPAEDVVVKEESAVAGEPNSPVAAGAREEAAASTSIEVVAEAPAVVDNGEKDAELEFAKDVNEATFVKTPDPVTPAIASLIVEETAIIQEPPASEEEEEISLVAEQAAPTISAVAEEAVVQELVAREEQEAAHILEEPTSTPMAISEETTAQEPAALHELEETAAIVEESAPTPVTATETIIREVAAPHEQEAVVEPAAADVEAPTMATESAVSEEQEQPRLQGTPSIVEEPGTTPTPAVEESPVSEAAGSEEASIPVEVAVVVDELTELLPATTEEATESKEQHLVSGDVPSIAEDSPLSQEDIVENTTQVEPDTEEAEMKQADPAIPQVEEASVTVTVKDDLVANALAADSMVEELSSVDQSLPAKSSSEQPITIDAAADELEKDKEVSQHKTLAVQGTHEQVGGVVFEQQAKVLEDIEAAEETKTEAKLEGVSEVQPVPKENISIADAHSAESNADVEAAEITPSTLDLHHVSFVVTHTGPVEVQDDTSPKESESESIAEPLEEPPQSDSSVMEDEVHAAPVENDSLAAGTEVERPKSPWMPSFQVTTIGRGVATEEEQATVDQDTAITPTEAEPTTADVREEESKPVDEQPAIHVTTEVEEDTEEVVEGDVEFADEPAVVAPQLLVDTSSLDEPAEQPRSWTPSYSVHSQGSPRQGNVDLQEAATEEEPPRPWTPSYSVHSQGSPLPAQIDLAEVVPLLDKEVVEERELEMAELEEMEFATNEEVPLTNNTPAQEKSSNIAETSIDALPEQNELPDAVATPGEVLGQGVLPDAVDVVEVGEVSHKDAPMTNDAPVQERLWNIAQTSIDVLPEQNEVPVAAATPEEVVEQGVPSDAVEVVEVEHAAPTPEAQVPQLLLEISEEVMGPSTDEVEQSSTHLSPHPEQERPPSPSWIPSYSVSIQGSPSQERSDPFDEAPAKSDEVITAVLPIQDVLPESAPMEAAEYEPLAVQDAVEIVPQVAGPTESVAETTAREVVASNIPPVVEASDTAAEDTEALTVNEDSNNLVFNETPTATKDLVILVNDGINVENLSNATSAAHPVSANSDEQEPSPWTPSYSVATQGPNATWEEAELNELEPLPPRAEPSEDVKDEVAVPQDTTAAKLEIPSVTIDAADTITDTPGEVFPTVENTDEVPEKPKFTRPRLASLDETAVTEGTLASPDAISPKTTRSRLESAASSRFFPGSWFSSPKIVDEGRTSLEVARGEFVAAKAAPSTDDVPHASVEDSETSSVESDETDGEQKRRWCVIM